MCTAGLPRIYEDFFCDFIIKALLSQGIDSSRCPGSELPAFGLAEEALSNELCTAATQSVAASSTGIKLNSKHEKQAVKASGGK